MLILERDRPAVEGRLRAARERDPRVAAVCRNAGARLDGGDDLLVLCAVDDELARLLPEAEHPLRRPVPSSPAGTGGTEPRAARAALRASIFGPRGPLARPRRRPPSPGAGPGEDPHAFEVDHLLAELVHPLDELRWPGGGRAGIERIARGIPSWDHHAREHLDACLAAVRVGPEGRAAMQRRARRLAALPGEVALVEALVAAVSRFAENHGAAPRAFVAPAPRLDQEVLAAVVRTPDPVDEERRKWLAGQAQRVETEPHRLRVRSREASEIAGVAPPWTRRGPASLAEALEAWRRQFGSPRDLDRLEAEIRRARVTPAAALAEALDDARSALAECTPSRSRRAASGGDPASVLAAALAAATGDLPAGAGAERPAIERLVAMGALGPDAVAAAIRHLSGAAA